MLGRALKSLFALNSPAGYTFDIIVVDDCSSDGTPSVIEQLRDECSDSSIRYVRHAVNRGVAAARNTCIQNSRGAWIAFFDDDEIADPNWLVELIRTATETGAECVGGPCVPLLPEESWPVSLRRSFGENPVMLRPARRFELDPRHRPNAVPKAIGTGNVLIQFAVFERVGLFDERRRRGEDMHFFLRAHQSGVRFAVAPGAIIYHMVPAERSEPDHLLSAAGRGGAVRAEVDIEVLGRVHTIGIAALRIARVAAWTIPSLVVHSLRRDQPQVLGKRCSLRYDFGYCEVLACILRASFSTH
jgi:GT2 family glycosyltransferase